MRSLFPAVLALLLGLSGLSPAWADEAEEDETGEAAEPEEKSPDEKQVDPEFEVVVRAKRPLGRDRSEDSVAVDGQRLRDSPRDSTLEALSQENAGVYVSGRGAFHGVANGASGGITIRGLSGSPNSQVLVVEDGVPDFMGIFGHPIPDAYIPFLLEDALIVKGGDSVLYGTNAMGGAVILRSRWRREEGFEIQSDSAYGSFATMREAAALLGRMGDLDVAAAFFGLSTDGHREGAGGDEIVGQVGLRYRLTPDLRLGLREKVVHLRGADPGPVTHPTPDHSYDVWRNNASLQLEWNRQPLRLTVTPFFNMGVHQLYDGFRSLDTVSGGIAEADLRVHSSTRLLLGLSGQRVDGRVENWIDGDRTPVRAQTDLAAYGQATVRPIQPLTLVAGGRILYSLTYGAVFLYKGGLRWDVLPGLYARTRVARNFRQPTLRELYLPFPTANPDLRPEYALNWELGLVYESEHVEIACTGYRTETEDMIRYFGAWPSAEVVNIDHAVIWGVEGRIGLRELGPMRIAISGDWRDVGRYTRQNPEAKVDLTVEAKQAFGPHRLAASLVGEWVHGLYMANYGRDPLPDVYALDLALRYRYAGLGHGLCLEPYLLLQNLLDRRYAYVAGYPMPGFRALLGLRAEI